MKIMLLSGGSGKRLWPLSNNSRSKQFLKILRGPETQLESMVQRVWRQLKSTKLDEHAYIATCEEQVGLIRSQLGDDVRIIIEPSRRDTFPAIALATSYLHSLEKIDEEEVVCVLPVDPFVDDAFFDTLKDLQDILISSSADLALLGVVPTYPSAKYGYILPSIKSHHSQLPYQVASGFIEKPDEEAAQQLIDKKALWNCGVFAFKIKFLLQFLSNRKMPKTYEELRNSYHTLPEISFDYEVVEKNSNIVIKKYDGSWKDLGTWNTLTDEIGLRQIGPGIISANCKNTYLVNELNLPFILQGLSDVIVAASPDGVLVTQKFTSDKIKSLVLGINSRPMYEERHWGKYQVLDYERAGEQKVLTKRLMVYAGKNLSYQTHEKRSEVWTVVNGEGLFAYEDKIYPVKPGSVLQIPAGAKHSIKAITDLQIIEVQMGTDLVEEDITRICMSWAEVEKRCSIQDHDQS